MMLKFSPWHFLYASGTSGYGNTETSAGFSLSDVSIIPMIFIGWLVILWNIPSSLLLSKYHVLSPSVVTMANGLSPRGIAVCTAAPDWPLLNGGFRETFPRSLGLLLSCTSIMQNPTLGKAAYTTSSFTVIACPLGSFINGSVPTSGMSDAFLLPRYCPSAHQLPTSVGLVGSEISTILRIYPLKLRLLPIIYA